MTMQDKFVISTSTCHVLRSAIFIGRTSGSVKLDHAPPPRGEYGDEDVYDSAEGNPTGGFCGPNSTCQAVAGYNLQN